MQVILYCIRTSYYAFTVQAKKLTLGRIALYNCKDVHSLKITTTNIPVTYSRLFPSGINFYIGLLRVCLPVVDAVNQLSFELVLSFELRHVSVAVNSDTDHDGIEHFSRCSVSWILRLPRHHWPPSVAVILQKWCNSKLINISFVVLVLRVVTMLKTEMHKNLDDRSDWRKSVFRPISRLISWWYW